MLKSLQRGVRVSLADRLNHQLPRELVAPLGQADLDRSLGAPIELAGSSCARAGAFRETAERRLEKTGLHQAVEMEGRERAGDLESSRGLVAAHLPGLPHHIEVERPAQGLLERRHSRQLMF